MSYSNLMFGFIILDTFAKWLDLNELRSTELGWYDKDGICVDMDVGYFIEAIDSFMNYFDKRLKEDSK